MTDGAVTSTAEVLAMEACVLQELEYNFTFPTSLSFLETYMQVIQSTDLATEQFTLFILDLSLADLNLQRHQPSTLALAALVIAEKTIS
jgi:hypothetical protein